MALPALAQATTRNACDAMPRLAALLANPQSPTAARDASGNPGPALL
jgi:hypothetical protein